MQACDKILSSHMHVLKEYFQITDFVKVDCFTDTQLTQTP